MPYSKAVRRVIRRARKWAPWGNPYRATAYATARHLRGNAISSRRYLMGYTHGANQSRNLRRAFAIKMRRRRYRSRRALFFNRPRWFPKKQYFKARGFNLGFRYRMRASRRIATKRRFARSIAMNLVRRRNFMRPRISLPVYNTRKRTWFGDTVARAAPIVASAVAQMALRRFRYM